jgi:AraC-like DNA-binding protein
VGCSEPAFSIAERLPIMAAMPQPHLKSIARHPHPNSTDTPTLDRDGMRYRVIRPHARLRERVRCYFVVEAGRHPTFRDELLLPDGDAELVFNFAAGFDRWRIDHETTRTPMQRSYVIGARTHSVVTRDWGDLKVVGVKLDPRFLRSIVREPLSTFSDTTLALNDLNDKQLLELEGALVDRSVTEVATVLDAFFMRHLRTFEPHDELDALIRRIQCEHGIGTVANWIRELGFNMRTLERRFAAWMGMSPKTYARIVRFKHSYRHLIKRMANEHKGDVDAHLDGYYDQSHFHKEFKYFTGTSPAAMLAAQSRSSLEVTAQLLGADPTIA